MNISAETYNALKELIQDTLDSSVPRNILEINAAKAKECLFADTVKAVFLTEEARSFLKGNRKSLDKIADILGKEIKAYAADELL